MLACFGCDEVNSIAKRLNLLAFFVGDLDVELFLDGHHEFDLIEGIGSQVLPQLAGAV